MMNNPRYPIRISLYITEEMDDSLCDLSELMGISKHEYIRFIIGQSLCGHKEAAKFLADKLQVD